MKREISDINILNDFTKKFCSIVEKYTKYIVVSGFVVIASGRVRGTEDIDMIIERIDYGIFEKFHKSLIKAGFICIQEENPNEIYEYLIENTSVRYTFKNNPLPEMELKFKKDKLDDYQFETKTKLKLTNLDIWFSSPEMNIAYKENYLKSQKNIEDAKHLRLVYEDIIDENEIEKIKKMIEVLRK